MTRAYRRSNFTSVTTGLWRGLQEARSGAGRGHEGRLQFGEAHVVRAEVGGHGLLRAGPGVHVGPGVLDDARDDLGDLGRRLRAGHLARVDAPVQRVLAEV